MSETEIRIGKVKEITFAAGTTFEEKIEQLKNAGHKIDDIEDNYIESDTLQIINNKVFEIIENKVFGEDDIAQASKDTDGAISYTLKYYNGGRCFAEMLDEAISEIEK